MCGSFCASTFTNVSGPVHDGLTRSSFKPRVTANVFRGPEESSLQVVLKELSWQQWTGIQIKLVSTTIARLCQISLRKVRDLNLHEATAFPKRVASVLSWNVQNWAETSCAEAKSIQTTPDNRNQDIDRTVAYLIPHCEPPWSNQKSSGS